MIRIILILLMFVSFVYPKNIIKSKGRIYQYSVDNRLNNELDNIYKYINIIGKEYNKTKNKAKVYNTFNFTITSNEFLKFSQEYFDIGAMHSTFQNNDRVYVTQTDEGIFSIGVYCKITPSTSTNIIIDIYKNNDIIASKSLINIDEAIYSNVNTIINAKNGDFFKIKVTTDNSITLDISNSTDTNQQFGFSVFRVL